jgi:hypothetical protein
VLDYTDIKGCFTIDFNNIGVLYREEEEERSIIRRVIHKNFSVFFMF